MRLSNPRKFFPVIGLLFLFIPACRIWQTIDNNNQVSAVDEPQSPLPFSTKAPEVYQTNVLIIVGPITQKYFIARDHEKWRIDYFTGERNERTILQNGSEYYLSFPKKIYAESPGTQTGTVTGGEVGDVMNGLMYHKPHADFEKLSRENNVTTYKARLSDSPSTEVLVYVNDAISIPVKQEFYSVSGDAKTLEYSVGFSDFSLTSGDDVFTIPDGFKKVTMQEFQKAVR